MLIPEDKITEIKNSADILEVVSESVQLKKTGRNFMGLCPFHSEKTPSFSVNPQREIFHCFGCGAGGNVFSFVMKRDGISFPEAAKMLANRYGIDIPLRKMSPAEQQLYSERESMYNLNSLAMDFFHHVLTASEQGRGAREYLLSRGMSSGVVSEFKLGFVPDGWDNLHRFLKSRNVPDDLAEKCGLLASKNKERYYDRFRNRVIFPILDSSRQVAGFGGRVLDNSLPKYLNSPETAIYNKSRLLYGFCHTRSSCRDTGTAHIVEGYFDLLALYDAGITNVVATLGTAVTREHIRMLSRGGVNRFVLVYDSDQAGIKAAERSIPVFQKEFVNASILVLPKGHDPDSYVREYGKEAFMRSSEEASGVIEFLTESAVKKYGLSVEGRLKIIDEMKEPLSGVSDSVARSLYVRELSGKIGVEETAILERLKEYSSGKSGRDVSNSHINSDRKSLPVTGIQNNGRWAEMENRILSMMLQFPDIIPVCIEENVRAYFDNNKLKTIAGRVMDFQGDRTAMVSELVMTASTNEEKEYITALAIGDIPWVYKNCVRLVHQFVTSRKKYEDSLSDRIREAEQKNDQALLVELINEKNILVKSLKEQQVQARKRY